MGYLMWAFSDDNCFMSTVLELFCRKTPRNFLYIYTLIPFLQRHNLIIYHSLFDLQCHLNLNQTFELKCQKEK